jgi:hypothetical protein
VINPPSAKIQLRTCQELEERNCTATVAVALNSTQSDCIEQAAALPKTYGFESLRYF